MSKHIFLLYYLHNRQSFELFKLFKLMILQSVDVGMGYRNKKIYQIGDLSLSYGKLK